jgi:hypothetical protein
MLQTLYYRDILGVGSASVIKNTINKTMNSILEIKNMKVFKDAIFDKTVNYPNLYPPYRK